MQFFTTYPLISLIAGFGLIVLLLAWFLFDLHRKWNRLFGKKASAAPDALGNIIQRLVRTEERLEAVEPRIDVLEKIGRIAVQKVGFMRFNPFDDTGGDQSFAICLLDNENNGVVFSSLYTREGVRVYAKEVKNGASKHPLSAEERKVLEEATVQNHKSQITNRK